MKKKCAGILFAFLLSFGASADVHALGSNLTWKTIKHYDGRTTMTGAPTYITFNPDYRTKDGKQSPQYRFYGGDKKFWEDFHWNEFHWYTIVPPQNPTADQQNMKKMLENNQDELGCNGRYLVSSSDCNLKKGRQDPRTRVYMGDNSGTTLITVGPYKGKHYEWRYLGYTPDGEPADNPFFPDDYALTDTKWYTRKWVNFEQIASMGYMEKTDYDYRALSKRIQWIKEKLLPVNPGLINPKKSLEENAEYYARVFSFRSDPDISTGIVTGWHNTNGRLRYVSFAMKKPIKPNLRLVEYDIYLKTDVDGDGDQDLKLIATAKRDPNDDDDIEETKKVLYNKVSRGQTYVFVAKVKNMKTGANRDTTYRPITLDHMYAFDEDALQFNDYSVVFESAQGAKPTTPKTVIKYGETVEFRWEYTVPYVPQKKILMGASIPIGFFEKGDNIYRGDDKSEFLFDVEQEDIGLVNRIELVDVATGDVADTVIPNHTYTLRYYVKKYKGNMPVGDAKRPDKNPFASIDATVSDQVTTEKGYRDQRATQTLKKAGDMVRIDIPNAVTPKGPCVFTRAVLNAKHRANGQSTDYSNDGPIEKRFCAEINISVKDFQVKPQGIRLPYNQSSSREDLSFSFTVTNYNQEGQAKDIPFVIYKEGSVLYRGSVLVPPNKPTTYHVAVSNVPLSVGDEVFQVEVNYPNPTRKWVEYLRDGSNPYKDNVAQNAITVQKNEKPYAECKLNHTRNTWRTTYSLYEWNGTRVYYWVPGWWEYDSKGRKVKWHSGYWDSYCRLNWTKSWTETRSHYEEYRVEHIYFKSKLTEDTAGGWVDVLQGGVAKVKAGYGFEMKIVVKYETTTRRLAPSPWTNDCSGLSVSPGWSEAQAPRVVTLTMPYVDKSGEPVHYNLTPTSVSGSWDDQTITYELPLRKTFNGESARTIYVNDRAKDGVYMMQLDTMPFYGTYDKPPVNKQMCERIMIPLRIVGAYTDDLKTHITQ